uniref:Uncharacterized protein n=1 Tax=Panagrolaimus sp. JU765 TaxID=591449 RepID=A0AC34RD45_9BILA
MTVAEGVKSQARLIGRPWLKALRISVDKYLHKDNPDFWQEQAEQGSPEVPKMVGINQVDVNEIDNEPEAEAGSESEIFAGETVAIWNQEEGGRNSGEIRRKRNFEMGTIVRMGNANCGRQQKERRFADLCRLQSDIESKT